MKPSSKRKPKKKKQPVQHVPEQIPPQESERRAAPLAAAISREEQRMAIIRELTLDQQPTVEEAERNRWAAAHGRAPRSLSMMSEQMGKMGIAGHLPRNANPPKTFNFSTPVDLGLGGELPWSNPRYNMPPQGGVRVYKSIEQRNWFNSDEREVQYAVVLEARALHYTLAREAHQLKAQHYGRLKEKNRCQHEEWDMQLQIEALMTDMYHCSHHHLRDQCPESCICCEYGQANIDRLNAGVMANIMLMDQLDDDQAKANEHRTKIERAVWNARLNAESAQGQLDFRLTSAGVFKPSFRDDSPYSTDRFEDEKQDGIILPTENYDPPEYEEPDAEFEDSRFL